MGSKKTHTHRTPGSVDHVPIRIMIYATYF
jgi:hypothetical protein